MPVSRYRVADDDADRRVDRVLRRLYPGLPLSRLYRALRTGAVMINHERARPDRRTRVGDELAVDLPTPVRAQEGSLGDEPALQLPDLPVVAENDGVRIVNKPAGLRMHGATAEQIQDANYAHFRSTATIKIFCPSSSV